jgi:hypothetical protein
MEDVMSNDVNLDDGFPTQEEIYQSGLKRLESKPAKSETVMMSVADDPTTWDEIIEPGHVMAEKEVKKTRMQLVIEHVTEVMNPKFKNLYPSGKYVERVKQQLKDIKKAGYKPCGCLLPKRKKRVKKTA